MSEGVERDRIRLNVGKGMLDLLVGPTNSTLATRDSLGPAKYPTGVLAKYRKLIGLAATGAVCG